MARKEIRCSRSRFGSQSEYEDCLEEQRERRRSGPAEGERLERGLHQMNADDEEIDD